MKGKWGAGDRLIIACNSVLCGFGFMFCFGHRIFTHLFKIYLSAYYMSDTIDSSRRNLTLCQLRDSLYSREK